MHVLFRRAVMLVLRRAVSSATALTSVCSVDKIKATTMFWGGLVRCCMYGHVGPIFGHNCACRVESLLAAWQTQHTATTGGHGVLAAFAVLLRACCGFAGVPRMRARAVSVFVVQHD